MKHKKTIKSGMSYTIKEERGTMVTEGKLIHIKSLINRAKLLELPTKKKKLSDYISSASIFILGFGTTNLVSIKLGILDISTNNQLIDYVLWGSVLIPTIILIGQYGYKASNNETKQSYVIELDNIVTDIQQQLD